MKKIIDMKVARKSVEQRKYRDMVLDAFDRREHETKRDQREQAAEVRRKARNAL
ncbi:hypothetical protein [Ralstonia mannitolilytica]|uniref:Uncharacterized protein n=1 Tax=Ralstonia mannitolilytica TaxID=105219 RepID=A0AAD2AXJ4_9RALS|nr:hypothetical protein [Ralstonia mannitolilytica]MBY4721001.1 hypothetical protein [Ralstonia mannitolilytica]CAJ0692987.1 hypothetical protein R77591_04011 [Ralstonia mannitolilytica]CAJ0894071.1 hypothetical protein R77569_04367 [Ralstonia mannitolilytica]